MNKISAFIITFNEEHKILDALKSVSFCDEIIVVDSLSTDNTVAICKDFGATVIERKWPGFAQQKQFALQQCKYKWCLNIDADERVSPQLQEEILTTLANNTKYSSFEIPGRNQFLGAMIPLNARLEYHVRLFQRECAHFNTNKLVHESITVSGKSIRMKNCLLHISKENIVSFNSDIDNYSSLRAEEKQQTGKKPSIIKLFFVFPLTFIKKYILQRNFLFGIRGVILSIMESYYAFLKEAKLWEISGKL